MLWFYKELCAWIFLGQVQSLPVDLNILFSILDFVRAKQTRHIVILSEVQKYR